MRAITYEQYGAPEVLRVSELATPTPKDDEVLIRVQATTVSAGDARLRSMKVPPGFGLLSRLIFGVTKPRRKILGVELAGEIVARGARVTRWDIGEQVFAMNGMRMGCHTEYICLPQDGAMARRPPRVSVEEAAALSFGGTTALDFLRRARLTAGERVLINGAAGCVGSAAVQLARNLGAQVTGVCGPKNLEVVRALGAKQVIDYSQETLSARGPYDVILDAVGNINIAQGKRLLRPGGRLLLVVAGLLDLLRAPLASLVGGKTVIAGPVRERAEDLAQLAALAEAGQYKPLIGHRLRLDEIVAAHRLVDSGHKQGSVVVLV